MAQNITLLGASYSDVPSVELPKTGGGTAQFDDTTIASNAASASDITSGKLAFVNGELVTGTASGGGATLITKSITANGTYNALSDNADGYSSVTVNVSGGGGGGLEYETGTWTPASDVASYTIQFSNTHTTPPSYYVIVDATGTYSNTTNSIYQMSYVQFDRLLGSSAYADYNNSGTIKYGRYDTLQRTTSTTSMSTQGGFINYPMSETDDSTTNHPRYWATETWIKAAGYSAIRYWRTGRTYKWIAVWAPTS